MVDSNVATQLVDQCLPALQSKVCSSLNAVTKVDTRLLQGVWTGEGGIAQVKIQSDSGSEVSFVAKSIGSYRGCDDMGLQDHWSYYNEACFYESDLPEMLCKAGALCPRSLHVARKSSGEQGSRRKSSRSDSGRLQQLLQRFGVKTEDGEEKDEAIICMTMLTGGRWSPSKSQEVLSWLARLHALFWGRARTDAAIAAGVSDQACFWHLDNRSIELSRMSKSSPLRLAAAAIDARLKADAMQTMCHGDPKGANIMMDDQDGVCLYDFQWFGKAPPTKDLAYFFATAAMNGRGWNKDQEDSYLRYYHGELCKLLEMQGDEKPSFEYLYNTYILAVVDYNRWIEGGFAWGNMSLISGHTQEFFDILLAGGKELKTEADYHARIFECFPP